MRKNRLRAAALLLMCTALAGCDGSLPAAGGAYLKDLDPSKYVTLGDYTGLTVQVDKPALDEEIKEQYATQRLSTLSGGPVTGRPAQLGDTANIDFAGRMADTGEYFDGGTSAGYDLVLGSGSFIPGFEDAVVGMEIGEHKDIPLTFPENYHSEALAGQDVVFEVTLNALSGLTDASVQALGVEGVSTLEEYTDYLKQEYADQVEASYRRSVEDAIRDQVESNAVFSTPPEAFTKRITDSYREQMEILAGAYSSAYGQTITVSDILRAAMSSEDYTGDEESYLSGNVTDKANDYLTAAAIAAEQGISVSDDEIRSEMEKNLSSTEYATIEEYMKASDLEEIRENLLVDKVMDFLVANNQVEAEEK